MQTAKNTSLSIRTVLFLLVAASLYTVYRSNFMTRSDPLIPTVNQIDLVNNFTSNDSVKGNNKFVSIDKIRTSKLIFVGGSGRSGTTLMRAILDVHSRIRCGAETKIVLALLDLLKIYVSTNEWRKQTHLTEEAVDDSMALFVYNVIASNGLEAERYCMKDPLALIHINYLHKLFPNAKFVYLVRDGRAATYSLITKRKENLTKAAFVTNLAEWNRFNAEVHKQCVFFGPSVCLMVKYEDDLVLGNELTVRRVVDFLGEQWEPGLLEHEKYIGSEIQLANNTWSGDQIQRPIYNDSLTNWMHKIPYLNESETKRIAPMLQIFNYNLTFDSRAVEAQKTVT